MGLNLRLLRSYLVRPNPYDHRCQNGGAQGGCTPPPPKLYNIVFSTILLPAMYGSRCICITVMTHVPSLSFNPTDAYAYDRMMSVILSYGLGVAGRTCLVIVGRLSY